MAASKHLVNHYVNHHRIETFSARIKSGETAIPKIQRPFVRDAFQIRDLLNGIFPSIEGD